MLDKAMKTYKQEQLTLPDVTRSKSIFSVFLLMSAEANNGTLWKYIYFNLHENVSWEMSITSFV